MRPLVEDPADGRRAIRTIRTSRRATRRRCANGRRSASASPARRMSPYLRIRLDRRASAARHRSGVETVAAARPRHRHAGLGAARAVLRSSYWPGTPASATAGSRIRRRGASSCSAFKVAAVIVPGRLAAARSSTRIAALGLGLIIGGAIGNAIDRLHSTERWWISPVFTSKSAARPSTGTCLTSPTWPSLPVWRPPV
jgi:hypothetical protein